jgi:hypothetical protein
MSTHLHKAVAENMGLVPAGKALLERKDVSYVEIDVTNGPARYLAGQSKLAA